MSKSLNETIKNTFPDKKIVNIKNPSLLVGTKVVYNDDVFEMSLKNSLDSIIENIENYD